MFAFSGDRVIGFWKIPKRDVKIPKKFSTTLLACEWQ
jgi:hypothetical protein